MADGSPNAGVSVPQWAAAVLVTAALGAVGTLGGLGLTLYGDVVRLSARVDGLERDVSTSKEAAKALGQVEGRLSEISRAIDELRDAMPRSARPSLESRGKP